MALAGGGPERREDAVQHLPIGRLPVVRGRVRGPNSRRFAASVSARPVGVSRVTVRCRQSLVPTVPARRPNGPSPPWCRSAARADSMAIPATCAVCARVCRVVPPFVPARTIRQPPAVGAPSARTAVHGSVPWPYEPVQPYPTGAGPELRLKDRPAALAPGLDGQPPPRHDVPSIEPSARPGSAGTRTAPW